MKRLHVLDRVMTSNNACTSGTSRVLTVASLQRLKVETLIPPHVDYEVLCVIKFLNALSIAPIKMYLNCARSTAIHVSMGDTFAAGVQLGGA